MNRDRLFNRRDQKTLAQAKPHVPVFDELQPGIETTCANQTRLAREHRRHRNEVVFEQVPEDVALRTSQRIDLARRKLPARITDQRLAVTHRDPIVAVSACNCLSSEPGRRKSSSSRNATNSTTLSDAGVASIRETAISVQSDVTNAGNLCADFRRVVSRTIVDDDHFEIRAGILRALDCTRQKPGTVISRDDDAYFRHDVCEAILATKRHKKHKNYFVPFVPFVLVLWLIDESAATAVELCAFFND